METLLSTPPSPEMISTAVLAAFDIDYEQSVFFFRFSESNARARERRSPETRVSRHQSSARPFACRAYYRKKRDCS